MCSSDLLRIGVGTFTDRTNSNPEGWNLVSNPYPAAISVSRFLAENDNIEGAVYFWDDNNSASARGDDADYLTVRSEERRVGKECRSRWSPYH